MIKHFFISATLLAASFVSAATTPTDVAQTRISEIIELSRLTGLSVQARNVTQQVLEEAQVPLGKQYKVVGVISSQWSADKLQAHFQSILNSYDAVELEQLAQALNNQHILSARKKELSAVAEQSSTDYQQYIQRLQTQKIAKGRLQYIRNLDQAMQLSAVLIKARQSIYAELKKNVEGWQPDEHWQQQLQKDVLSFLFYVHRGTSNQELQQLINYYRQPQLSAWLSDIKNAL